MKKIALSLVGLFVLCSCATLQPRDRYYYPSMLPVLYYKGFQVNRPTTMDWYIRVEDVDRYPGVLIRNTKKTQTYDCFFDTHLISLPRNPISLEDFDDLVKAELTRISEQDRERIETISISTDRTIRNGHWTVKFRLKTLDRFPVNSPVPLVIQDEGYLYLHPAREKTALKSFFSQRGLESELIEQLPPDVATLLDGVKLRDQNGKLID